MILYIVNDKDLGVAISFFLQMNLIDIIFENTSIFVSKHHFLMILKNRKP